MFSVLGRLLTTRELASCTGGLPLNWAGAYARTAFDIGFAEGRIHEHLAQGWAEGSYQETKVKALRAESDALRRKAERIYQRLDPGLTSPSLSPDRLF